MPKTFCPYDPHQPPVVHSSVREWLPQEHLVSISPAIRWTPSTSPASEHHAGGWCPCASRQWRGGLRW